MYEYDFADIDFNTLDKTGTHGTHVAGTAAGKTTGIASEADIVMLKVFSDNTAGASYADIKAALRWVVNNCSEYNVASVNLSLGRGNYDYEKIDTRSVEFWL